ncbi:zinc metalloproteinase-disintegrin-like crotastatin [Clytia hemisphaerica]|uniref:Uncharacterized protein n=1 Tax=Clytia hemisphaerica TaxID=252671 RepID=A0A7M5XBV5_9CNID
MILVAYQLLFTTLVASIIGNQWTTAASIGLYHGTIGHHKQNRCFQFHNSTQRLVHATLESNTINETLFFVEATGRSKTNPKRKLRNITRKNLQLSPRFFFGLANKRIDAEMSLIPNINHGGFLISLTCRHRFAKKRVSIVFEAAVESYRSPDNCLYPVTKQTEFTMGRSKTIDGTHLVSIKRSRRDSTINDTNPSLDLDFDIEEHQGLDTNSVNPKVTEGCKMGKKLQRQRRETGPRQELKIEPETRGPFYVRINFVVDHNLYNKFEQDTTKITDRMNMLIQYADTVYRKYNIRILLAGVTIWTTKEEIEFNTNSGDVLSRFSTWAASGEYGRSRFPESDHIHLITGYKFAGDVIGKAYYRSMCAPSTSVGYTSDSPSWELHKTVSIFVHELGHSLGMSHDEHTCVCKHTRGCFMATFIVTPAPKYFTDCSVDGLHKYLDSWRSQCLRDKPPIENAVKIFDKECGNNVIDPGEECDCGLPGFCMNQCCNPNTCKLNEGSECFEGGCCKDCKLKAKGTVCREQTDDCDLPDSCDGHGAVCPNHHKEDGTTCAYNGKCVKGKCKSRTVQCERLFGKGTMNGPYNCYTRINRVGRDFGNCGIKRFQRSSHYIACKKKDAECGKLQCKSPTVNVMPINGWRTAYVEVNLRFGNGKCKSALFGYGGLGEEDPTMVQDGTPCGKGGVCKKASCITAGQFTSLCNNCPSDRGWCTERGTCQCNPEWDGLNCQYTLEQAKRSRKKHLKWKKQKLYYDNTIKPDKYIKVI